MNVFSPVILKGAEPFSRYSEKFGFYNVSLFIIFNAKDEAITNTKFHKKTSMKVLLDIQDDKATSLMEVLESLPYVETKQLTESKAELISDIREAVEEMKLIKAGKKQARNVEDFLNEL